MRPRFHKSKHVEEGDDEDGEEGEVAEWSVRKCAASGLDVLAATFGAAILPHLLPELEVRKEMSGKGRERKKKGLNDGG